MDRNGPCSSPAADSPAAASAAAGIPVGQARAPTRGEVAMCRDVFGDAIDYPRVRVYNRKFWFAQPPRMAMAPNGNIYFHPSRYLDDFARAPVLTRAWFIHEMGHVWQHQQGVNVYMAMLNRVYDYASRFGRCRFEELGLEQQCEVAADYYLLRHGCRPCWGNWPIEEYERLLPFRPRPRAPACDPPAVSELPSHGEARKLR